MGQSRRECKIYVIQQFNQNRNNHSIIPPPPPPPTTTIPAAPLKMIPAAPLKMISLLRQPVILSVIFNYLFLSEELWSIWAIKMYKIPSK
jgi:hypothetical protein